MRRRERATAAALQHMARIKALPCICCTELGRAQESPTDCHHIREDRQARNDWLTIPLCRDCHQGAHGVHGDRTYLRILKASEWDMLALTLQRLLA